MSKRELKMSDANACSMCGRALTKDESGLNSKILDGDVKRGIWRCLSCMAEYLECEAADLEEKIEEFKSQGCKLFS